MRRGEEGRARKTVLGAMPELQLKTVEFAREHGLVTIGEVIQATGASRTTLKQHFRALVERGTPDRHDGGRGVWFGLRRGTAGCSLDFPFGT